MTILYVYVGIACEAAGVGELCGGEQAARGKISNAMTNARRGILVLAVIWLDVFYHRWTHRTPHPGR